MVGLILNFLSLPPTKKIYPLPISGYTSAYIFLSRDIQILGHPQESKISKNRRPSTLKRRAGAGVGV